VSEQPPNRPEESPVLETRELAAKPTKHMRFFTIAAMIVLAAAIGLVTLQSFSAFRAQRAQLAARNQGMNTPGVMDPDEMSNYAKSNQAAIAQAAQDRLNRLRQEAMEECQKRGWTPTTKPDGTVTCDTPTMTDIVPPTPQQQAAMARGGYGGRSSTPVQRERPPKTNLLAIDFSGSQPVTVPPIVGPPQASQPSRDQAPPTANPGLAPATADADKKPKYDWDSYTGKQYRVMAGTYIESVLANRLDGEFTGPVDVMVDTPIYSHNLQELLIPAGTRIIGECRKIGSNYQRRLAVVFHRMIMPDGFSVDLDRFIGLDQVGSAALAAKVNHHYVAMFGSSVALGLIAGLSQIGNSTNSLGYSPSVSIRNGMSQQLGQEGEETLNRLTNIPPTVKSLEGSRVRVYISNDLLFPAYANHTVVGDL
jgi:type IV secretory pathway VirB10-like protein